MADEGFKSKLAAILSVDVDGYSLLMHDDEEPTARTLQFAFGNNIRFLAVIHGISQIRLKPGNVITICGSFTVINFAKV